MTIEDYKELCGFMRKEIKELKASKKLLKDLAESLLEANRSN